MDVYGCFFFLQTITELLHRDKSGGVLLCFFEQSQQKGLSTKESTIKHLSKKPFFSSPRPGKFINKKRRDQEDSHSLGPFPCVHGSSHCQRGIFILHFFLFFPPPKRKEREFSFTRTEKISGRDYFLFPFPPCFPPFFPPFCAGSGSEVAAIPPATWKKRK